MILNKWFKVFAASLTLTSTLMLQSTHWRTSIVTQLDSWAGKLVISRYVSMDFGTLLTWPIRRWIYPYSLFIIQRAQFQGYPYRGALVKRPTNHLSSNRVCKIIRTCTIERKLYLEVTQDYTIWVRVPQSIILEGKIDCRSFLNPLSLWELNDLQQRFWFWQDFILYMK